MSITINFNDFKELKKRYMEAGERSKAELDEIGDLFGSPDTLELYVEPHCQHNNPVDSDELNPVSITQPISLVLTKFLNGQRINRDGSNHLFVLADAGMGKSSLLVMLKLSHLAGYWPAEENVKLLRLGPDTLGKIRSVQGQRRVTLLLDALDEDPESFGSISRRIGNILSATNQFRRVIITCRTQFFEGTQDPFQRAGMISVGNFNCPLIYLSQFSDEQVKTYLLKRYPGDEQARERGYALRLIEQMDSLRCRPMLLANIEHLLQVEPTVVNEHLVFKAMIESWLQRECRKEFVELRGFTRDDLWNGCVVIAKYMERANGRFVSLSDIESLVQAHPKIMGIQAIDVGGRSLLNRTSRGDYRFSHYSVQEYLAIRALIEDPPEATHDWLNRLTQLQVRFLVQGLEAMPPKARARINTKNLPFGGLTLTPADVSRANFAGSNFHGGRLSKVNFRGCVLQGAKFDDSDLADARLDGSNCVRATFERARLSGATLDCAELRTSKFDSATLTGASMKAAKADNASFGKADLRDVQLTRTILDESYLKGADLRGAELVQVSFRRCDITGATFDGTQLIDCVLDHVTALGASFRNAKLTRCSVMGSNLDGIDFEEAVLEDTTLTGATLRGARLKGARLPRSVLSADKLQGVKLDGVDLSGASLVGDLAGIDFSGASLIGNDLARRDCRAAKFERSKLSGVVFEGTDLSGGSSLREADGTATSFKHADLSGVDAHGASFIDADLTGCILREANLQKSNFFHPKLEQADFGRADLRDASFTLRPEDESWEEKLRQAGAKVTVKG